MPEFVDRESELDALEARYASDDAEFVVLYGRRRLGKSELVRRSIADRTDAVYYQAIESTAPNQIDQFVETVTDQFPGIDTVRRDWEAILGALVIDHDIYMIDLLSDRLLVFDGDPAEHGHASQPQPMRDGMNEFLENLEVTFRRDERVGRPRINKPGSQLDREQKRSGEYYYSE